MPKNFTVHIGGRTYTADDLARGEHRDDLAITEPGGTVVNVNRGGVVGIQAGVITGDITFD
ncbi:hypothetical protein GCM10027271_14600 [Saccharopolyspora gloriosae]|uniref:Uncharacterized protein n=1 Tax=Saccharopolyspora gloriosae TaxID=455344 RepID=A0A840N9E3_9PSEU|nr:hypothetical protein [Saccharopolyspora gloriosae]MBB5067013.1 hypothetical protein [Saccharopolyspora gloriosae]